MAVLAHALMFIASLFATPGSATDVAAVCQTVPSLAHAVHIEREWARSPHQHGVRVYAAIRTRDVAPLRVLGRCVLKPAPEHQERLLFGSVALQIDDQDDDRLASGHNDSEGPFPDPAVVGARRTEMYVMRAPRTQLERPPRV